MDTADRTRACYLHACLQYVLRKRMTNKSLRERFGAPDSAAPKISNVIRDTVKAGLIRPGDPDSASKRYANYVPYWA